MDRLLDPMLILAHLILKMNSDHFDLPEHTRLRSKFLSLHQSICESQPSSYFAFVS